MFGKKINKKLLRRIRRLHDESDENCLCSKCKFIRLKKERKMRRIVPAVARHSNVVDANSEGKLKKKRKKIKKKCESERKNRNKKKRKKFRHTFFYD